MSRSRIVAADNTSIAFSCLIIHILFRICILLSVRVIFVIVYAALMSGPSQKSSSKTFIIPDEDQKLLEAIQSRARKADIGVNFSEIVRAGLAALMALPDRQFGKCLTSRRRLPRGRPREENDQR